MKKLLIFDIDGTLLLTGGTGRIAFERAFQELYGIEDSWGDVVPDGKTDQIIFGEIFKRHFNRLPGPNELKHLFTRYASHFELEIDHTPGFQIMPGIPVLIDHLSTLSHVTLGIATGNIAEVSRFKLRRANLHTYFRFMGTASDSHDRPTLVKHAIDRGLAFTGPLETSSIFVIGDAACAIGKNDKPLPGIAPVAIQQGRYVANIIANDLPQNMRKPFKYFDKGSLATIGKNKAVCVLGKLQFGGFFAWLVWGFIHVAYLVAYRSRIGVLTEWVFHYMTGMRGARLIQHSIEDTDL